MVADVNEVLSNPDGIVSVMIWNRGIWKVMVLNDFSKGCTGAVPVESSFFVWGDDVNKAAGFHYAKLFFYCFNRIVEVFNHMRANDKIPNIVFEWKVIPGAYDIYF